MRLLQYTKTSPSSRTYAFSLIKCDARYAPQYAILSHRWGADDDEVTFRDIEQGTVKERAGGYKKLEFCAQQAERDGLKYFWVDTCCIDKTNSAELQEAINSMYKWYKQATKCYVYLLDVSAEQEQGWKADFRKSEWFSRGWTLQDLLAPQVVEFFSVEGQKLGDKSSLERQIHQITGIAIEALQGKPLSQFSAHERFSWAARRQTIVEEDAVYCLLGIFDVHMPLLYGEGQQKALIRLQREILLQNDPDLYGIKEAAWIVPFERNSRFTGRDAELAELERRLTVDTGTTKIAITGLGGTGKTQLVLELLYRHKQKHRDCSIMWIPAIRKESVEQGYLTIAQQLGLLGHSNHNTNVEKLVQDYLSKDTAGPWLLVYDNADDVDLWTAVSTPASHANRDEQNQESFKEASCLIDCLPRSKQGCIIFTTRNKKVAVMLAQSNVMTVPAMDEKAAAQLLRNLLCDPSLAEDSHNVSRLLAELTYLPLAIAQAAAYINLNAVTISDYVSLLEKEEDVADVFSEDFENHGRYRDSKNTTAAVWLVSFEQIRQANPLAIEYLSFMACISPRDVPQSLLPPGPSRKKEIDAIGTLVAYSFVSRKTFSDALDTHQLVHLATRNMLRIEGSLHERMDRTISRIEEVFPNDNHENRSVWRAYLPHAQQVLAFSMSSDHNEKRTALIKRCGKCLYNDGRWAEAEQLFAQALEIDKIRLGTDHPDTLVSMANLALTYMSQGQWEEAEQLQVQVTAARIARLGASHPSTLISISNLASTYRRQGRWEEAEQLQVQVVEMCKKQLDVNDFSTLTSMSSLASTYSEQGRWAEAEQLQAQVLDIYKTQRGANHPDTLTSASDLALTYKNQERWDEAEQLETQVLKTRELELGKNHPDTLTSMNNLAATYSEQSRWEEAEQLQLYVIETRTAQIGADHPDTLTTMGNLALTYQRQRRWEEAEPLQIQVLEAQKTKLGISHPVTLSSMINLASTYDDRGQQTEAEHLRLQIMEARKMEPLTNRSETWTSVEDLVTLLRNQDKNAEADQMRLQMSGVRNEAPNETRLEVATLEPWHDSGIGSSVPTATHGSLSMKEGERANRPDFQNTEIRTWLRVSRIDASDEDIGSLIMDHQDERNIAEYYLSRCLGNEAELIRLVAQLQTEMSEDVLRQELVKHLKYFFLDLRSCSTNRLELQSAALLQSRRLRERLSDSLIRKLHADYDSNAEDFEQSKTGTSVEDTIFVLERWFSEDSRFHDSDDIRAQEALEQLDIGEISGNYHKDGSMNLTGGSQPPEQDASITEDNPFQLEQKNVEKLERFMLHGLPFRRLLQRLQSQTIRLPYISLREILMTVAETDIEFCFPESASWTDKVRRFIEVRSTARWNWWPLNPPKLASEDGYCRIIWRCDCRLNHFRDTPVEDARRLQSLIHIRCAVTNDNQQRCKGRLRRQRGWQSFRHLRRWITPDRDVFDGIVSVHATAAGSSQVTAQVARTPQAQLTSSTASQPALTNTSPGGSVASYSTTVAPYPYQMATYSANVFSNPLSLLFGVEQDLKQRHVTPLDLRTRPVSDDVDFVQRLLRAYRTSRGVLKVWFSVFRLDTCVFCQFNQLREDSIHYVKSDWPDDHSDYEYRSGEKKPPVQSHPPDPSIPPITEDQFRCDLSFCIQPCVWEWLVPWHRCRCSQENILVDRVPKKKSEWKFQQQGSNNVWGLDCKLEISGFRVLVYHLLMIAGTLVFWGLWQSQHPNDVSNAGVPISVMGCLISAFWSASGVLAMAGAKRPNS